MISNNLSKFKIGTRITHPDYGPGTTMDYVGHDLHQVQFDRYQYSLQYMETRELTLLSDPPKPKAQLAYKPELDHWLKTIRKHKAL